MHFCYIASIIEHRKLRIIQLFLSFVATEYVFIVVLATVKHLGAHKVKYRICVPLKIIPMQKYQIRNQDVFPCLRKYPTCVLAIMGRSDIIPGIIQLLITSFVLLVVSEGNNLCSQAVFFKLRHNKTTEMNDDSFMYRVILKYWPGVNSSSRQFWNKTCAASKLRELIYMTD